MEENYTGSSTDTSTRVENGVVTKIVTTVLTKADGSTKTITETTVTLADGSTTKTEAVSVSDAQGPAIRSVDINTFRQQALKAHNERRAKHGVPALTLTKELNDYAQCWADHLIKTGTFAHSECTLKDKSLGENIANRSVSCGVDCTGEEVTDQWYSEIAKYDYKKDQQPGTGHFSQVVWKDSKEMGIGKAHDSKGKVICVASYFPAGNMEGMWNKNVFPPK